MEYFGRLLTSEMGQSRGLARSPTTSGLLPAPDMSRAEAMGQERTSAKTGAMSVSSQKVAPGTDAQHSSAGTSAGAPLYWIRNTRNFAGWVAFAFRSAYQR